MNEERNERLKTGSKINWRRQKWIKRQKGINEKDGMNEIDELIIFDFFDLIVHQIYMNAIEHNLSATVAQFVILGFTEFYKWVFNKNNTLVRFIMYENSIIIYPSTIISVKCLNILTKFCTTIFSMESEFTNSTFIEIYWHLNKLTKAVY